MILPNKSISTYIMDNLAIDNNVQSLSSIHTKENDIVRLFNELLPWTFNCQTLIDAARNGLTSECEDLIRLGADINESDNYGNTAVWTSYFHEHLDTLFTLLQVDFDINYLLSDFLVAWC
jgi:ankyrin repeat protein